MTEVARINDTIDHGGHIIEGSDNVFANARNVARVGDQVICDVHGLVHIVSGNPNWKVNGKDIARIGSLCSCGALVNSGSPNVISNH